MKETRVGYATIDALADTMLDYIKVNPHDTQVLIVHDRFRMYLSGLIPLYDNIKRYI